MGTQQIIEHASSIAGKKFSNLKHTDLVKTQARRHLKIIFPEERFYNKTVIIDIIPAK